MTGDKTYDKDCTRICLWSGPRNISTALMYSFGQRSDTQIVDEPLYAHYLSKTNAKSYHPGSLEIIENMENDGAKVIAKMMGPQNKPVVFFKHMTHHLLDLDLSFLPNVKNVLLTRDPIDMLPSYAKAVPNPGIHDVGYALHLDLVKKLEDSNQEYIVLDSKKVLDNPRRVLSALCERLEIPFEEQMLKWEAGARKEDGAWAKYWYESVHRSTEFMKYKAKTAPFPEELRDLLATCQPYYEKLSALALS
jgi:hypothetical protein